eukprot:TRINITY_DN21222_c0_g1_i1.p1 TRINITY_DN21222_c0_g1~~TRINITY_DN21222_c0_g1_i1.p1  ORF type:complete len:250 (-),score=36.63 TRINITY_DN21222_c0_g1_i1:74-823(-)
MRPNRAALQTPFHVFSHMPDNTTSGLSSLLFAGREPPKQIILLHTTCENISVKEYLTAVNFELLTTPGFGAYEDEDVELLGFDLNALEQAGLPPLRIMAFAWDFAGGFFGLWIPDGNIGTAELSACPVVYVSALGRMGVMAKGIEEYISVLCALNHAEWGCTAAAGDTAHHSALTSTLVETIVDKAGWSKSYLSFAQTDEEADRLFEGRQLLLSSFGISAAGQPFRIIASAQDAFPVFSRYAEYRKQRS